MKRPEFSELTLREKIGQTCQMQMSYLMNMDNLEEYLAENPIGNVWHTCNEAMTTVNLAGLTIDEPQASTYYRKWTQRMTKALRVPPLFTLDDPGPSNATDLPKLVSLPLIGATDNDELAEEYGKYLSLNAKALGGNSTWSPVVDIPSRFAVAGIMRAVSDQPEKLSRLSLAIIKGGQDHGFGMCAKHFPGVDKIEYRDSHFVCPKIADSYEDWKAVQGKVFQDMIDGGVWSIMPGHQGFPAVDDRKIANYYMPATLSDKIITKLLKEEMHFDGVVVTDAIEMAALKTAYPDKEDLFVALLNAGNDIILNVKRLDYIDIIEKAVKDGRVSEERIDDAARRVYEMKVKMGLFDDPEEVVMTDELRDEICDFNRRVAEKALVLQCDNNKQLPLDANKIKNVAIICSTHHAPFFDQLQTMKAEFERRGINVRLQRRLGGYDEIEQIANENDLILYVSYTAVHAPMGGMGLYAEECATFFFALHSGEEKSIGVTFGSPYIYYDYCNNFNTFIHAFSPCDESQIAVVKALFGELPFEGIFPFDAPWENE